MPVPGAGHQARGKTLRELILIILRASAGGGVREEGNIFEKLQTRSVVFLLSPREPRYFSYKSTNLKNGIALILSSIHDEK